MSETVLEINDLTLRHAHSGAELVRDVSLSLERGQVLGVVGESGSGKTLTIRAALGVLPPLVEIAEGSVEVLGRRTDAFSEREWLDVRGNVLGAVFQDPGSYLNPSIRLGAQVSEVLRVKKGLSRSDARAETLRLFTAVHLRDPELVYEQYVHELSGGMLQRVLIASAIALDPDILIADEATTALDVTVQAEVLDLLSELKDSQGLSMVVISHDLAVVAQLCDEVVVMKDGEIIEQGSATQILRSPRHEYTKLLISEHDRFGLDRFVSPRHSLVREAAVV